ncbi:MAG: histone deacetylase [Ardenticatenales bacterium]|nr:histone deacetylase [Ardenticatenales bacterium]
MSRSTFATYLHPHTTLTSKARNQIDFVGFSLPYWDSVRHELAQALQNFPSLPPRMAEFDDYLRVHTSTYLQQLHLMAAEIPPEPMPRLSGECTGLEYALPGYQYGLGGMMEAIDQMRAGVLERAYCFSLGGHHAHTDWGHGYCLLNPLAAAARYAQEQGFERILIVDWDIHHGDGTQAIFAHDPTVYCISIHSAADLYMGFTAGLEHGSTVAGQRTGHCNLPLLSARFEASFWEELGLGGEFYRARESLSVFRDALAQLPWVPDLICIFSGYDGHREDGGKGITEWGNDEFRQLTRAVLEVARRADCPILSVHGGGYKGPITVAAALSHVEELAR